MAGFTKQQLESLDKLFDQKFKKLEDRLLGRSAPLPAPPPSPQPELPPLPPTNPPTPACAPPPSIDTLKEVEYKQADKSLRHSGKQSIIQKPRASKALPESRDTELFVFGNIIAWPPKFGGTNMRLSRDEHLDAWYTTMLNTHGKAHQI